MNTIMLMLLGHLVSDYTLQGWLADAKQRNWWAVRTSELPAESKVLYRHDWMAGLACHALYWSLVTFLPLYGHPAWWVIVLSQASVHAVVDHLKCNAHRINLWQDQLLHLLQILVAYWLFV